MSQVDFEALGKTIGGQAVELFSGLVEGAAADLQAYGEEISKDLLRAVRDDRPEIAAEVKNQIKLLAEIHRLRTVSTSWEVVANAALMLAKAARAGLQAAGFSF